MPKAALEEKHLILARSILSKLPIQVWPEQPSATREAEKSTESRIIVTKLARFLHCHII
jgi:hypothetical protein